VAPKGFSGISSLIAPEVWLPLGLHGNMGGAFTDELVAQDLNAPKSYALNVIARLQSGLTIDSAKARLPVVAERLTAIQPPDAEGTREIQLTPLSRFSISTTPSDDGPTGLMATLLLAMSGVVL